jgi:hypothetical protein
VAFDPMVEAIRSALRTLDKDPKRPDPYLDLIDAYEKCAAKESEPELLEQAGFVIRDVKQLRMTEDQKRRLAELEERVAATLHRIRETTSHPPDPPSAKKP